MWQNKSKQHFWSQDWIDAGMSRKLVLGYGDLSPDEFLNEEHREQPLGAPLIRSAHISRRGLAFD